MNKRNGMKSYLLPPLSRLIDSISSATAFLEQPYISLVSALDNAVFFDSQNSIF